MATYTTNLNLKKPALTDNANIADINSNMDIIDAELKQSADHAADAGIHVTALKQEEWDGKASQDIATTSTAGLMSSTDKTKLNAHTNDTGIHVTATERTNYFTGFASTVRATVLTGLSTATNAVITATDSILTALGKLQKQVTDHSSKTTNPHAVTKSQVGLGNVDNTADVNKNVLSATKLATARTVTIGSSGKTFDGRGNVSYSLGEIGAASTVTYSATLSTTWSGTSAPYTKTVTVNGILAADNPIFDVVMSGTYSTDSVRLEEYGKIYRLTTTANSITFYAKEKPTVSLPIQLKVVR